LLEDSEPSIEYPLKNFAVDFNQESINQMKSYVETEMKTNNNLNTVFFGIHHGGKSSTINTINWVFSRLGVPLAPYHEIAVTSKNTKDANTTTEAVQCTKQYYCYENITKSKECDCKINFFDTVGFLTFSDWEEDVKFVRACFEKGVKPASLSSTIITEESQTFEGNVSRIKRTNRTVREWKEDPNSIIDFGIIVASPKQILHDDSDRKTLRKLYLLLQSLRYDQPPIILVTMIDRVRHPKNLLKECAALFGDAVRTILIQNPCHVSIGMGDLRLSAETEYSVWKTISMIVEAKKSIEMKKQQHEK